MRWILALLLMCNGIYFLWQSYLLQNEVLVADAQVEGGDDIGEVWRGSAVWSRVWGGPRKRVGAKRVMMGVRCAPHISNSPLPHTHSPPHCCCSRDYTPWCSCPHPRGPRAPLPAAPRFPPFSSVVESGRSLPSPPWLTWELLSWPSGATWFLQVGGVLLLGC